MSAILGRQPVVWIGAIATLALAILQAVSGVDVVVPGQPAQTAANLIKIVGPIIAAFIAQNFVTPTNSPVLPAGTVVTTPEGHPAQVTFTAPQADPIAPKV